MKTQDLENAFIFTGKEYAKEKGLREDIYIINENSPALSELLEITREVKDECGDFDLSYEITAKACDIITEAKNDNDANGDGADFTQEIVEENNYESASVYNQDRLEYLNVWNQDDIAGIVREMECDISTACTVWYDRQVMTAVSKLFNLIIE